MDTAHAHTLRAPIARCGHDRRRQSGQDADRAAEGRGQSAGGAHPGSGNERQSDGGQQLPPENGAYRLAQSAKHGVGILRAEQSPASIAIRRGMGQFAALRQSGFL